MSYSFLFPEGTNKILTFSFDDANIADRKLVELFNKYNLKATFHLNSGLFNSGLSEGDHNISGEEVKELYKGHEVACHGVKHEFMNNLPTEFVVREVLEDRRNLEKFNDSIVVGYSYPYGQYSDELITKLKAIGIQYARTVESTNNFWLPNDFMKWNPTCRQGSVTDDRIRDFFNPPSFMKLSLFYIWGHSFEFDRNNDWDRFEEVCNKLHGRKDVWYATNLEIKRYIMALRSVVTNIDNTKIYNPSGETIWIEVNGEVRTIKPGEELRVES